MLVLSRRVNEEVCFPHLGIQVVVLRAQGNRVRLGIQAPASVEISRGPANPEELSEQSPSHAHRIRNELNAVRLAVELYDRQMAAGDVDGANCTFLKLMTRLRRADADFGQSTAPALVATQANAPNVLVVEDDANERELLAGLLQLDGCQVAMAEDGRAALNLLQQGTQPDLLLLDMHMPRLGGRETLSAIRTDQRLRNVPIFGVSGNTAADCGIAVGTADGVDEWFQKPLNPSLLVSRMRQRLSVGATTSA